MKIVKLVLPFILYGVIFYLFYTNLNDKEYLLSDTLFASGLFIVFIYSIQFIREGGYGMLWFGSRGSAAVQGNALASTQAINEAVRLNRQTEKVTKTEGYEDYINGKRQSGFPPTFLALPLGLISVIVSLFV